MAQESGLSINDVLENVVFLRFSDSRCRFVCADHPKFATYSVRKAIDHVLLHFQEVNEVSAQLSQRGSGKWGETCDIRHVFLDYVSGLVNKTKPPRLFRLTFELFAPCSRGDICEESTSSYIHLSQCPHKTRWWYKSTRET